MIQRIQSLFLLIVLVLSISLFFVPIYALETSSTTGGNASTGIQYFTIASNIVYIVLNSAAGIFALISIILFKNRRLQIRLCSLNMLIICIFTGTIFYFADNSTAGSNTQVQYNIGCYFPLVQLVFTFLSIRAIRKDEALVRSADRLR